MKVVTVAQMQALEAASEQAGVSTDALMENAGLAGAERIQEQMGGVVGREVLALIGPGNNGADGLVIARHLRRWGAEVCCYVVRGRPVDDPKMADALSYGVSVRDADDDPDLAMLNAQLSRAAVVVDAILGAGRYRPLEGAVAGVAASVNRHRRENGGPPVIAIDLPTGVNPDTGAADGNTITADVTLALGCPKVGIANFPGAGYAGAIEILSIGMPAGVVDDAGLDTDWMTGAAAGGLLPARPLDSHKGTFGHLLVVAGSRQFVGAAALACQAAHRVGAGLVTAATPASVYPIVAGKLTETIHLPLPEDGEGRIGAAAAGVIRGRMGGYSALAVGCGMGMSDGTAEFVRRLLLDGGDGPGAPSVIDADGLNNLARWGDWSDGLKGEAILTPHPGEMATLTGQSTASVQANRLDIAREWAERWGQTVLLKGAHSVVASPDTSGRRCVLPFANPALAGGGTGDVLTGIIGGLLAQGVSGYDAARLGGYLHGAAGAAARRQRGDAGVIASDLLDWLPAVMRDLRRGVLGGAGIKRK